MRSAPSWRGVLSFNFADSVSDSCIDVCPQRPLPLSSTYRGVATARRALACSSHGPGHGHCDTRLPGMHNDSEEQLGLFPRNLARARAGGPHLAAAVLAPPSQVFTSQVSESTRDLKEEFRVNHRVAAGPGRVVTEPEKRPLRTCHAHGDSESGPISLRSLNHGPGAQTEALTTDGHGAYRDLPVSHGQL
jgi:hypothetical protein